jgi:hypothetical protein
MPGPRGNQLQPADVADRTPADEALARWATEIVPAVREAIA